MLSTDFGTCSWLAEELAAARIVDRERLEPLLAELTRDTPYADADAFAQHLIHSGVVTHYQAKRALDGEARKLVLGAYLIVEVIGNGSLGPVYRAIGRSDRKSYALRVLPQRAWNVRSARNQIRAFEELPEHVGIVPFIDVGTSQGLHYLAWPFVEGRSLEEIVRECGPLDVAEAARIGVQVAEVLQIYQRRNIIHGFLKPSNIQIAANGQARLLDSGIGALLADNHEDESLVDTVARAEALARMLECSAPESSVDPSKWTAAGDQYSLGCTLYFSLTGRFPFPGGTFVEKIIGHQSGKPTAIRLLNPDVPPGLVEVIEKLMQKTPSDRYHRLDELLLDLTPMATVSRLGKPAPVNIQTPRPQGKLTVPTSSTVVNEPPALTLDPLTRGSGFFGKLFGSRTTADSLCITIVAAQSTRTPMRTIVLHVYIHNETDGDRLHEALLHHPAQPRILATKSLEATLDCGAWLALLLEVDGAVVETPQIGLNRSSRLTPQRFVIKIPNSDPTQLWHGRLWLGHDTRWIGHVDFTMAIADIE